MSLSQVKVICFYTRNTPYEQEVIHLINSCKYFGIRAEIEPIETEGSWEKNVARKPLFIFEKLKTTTLPLLWVDADAAFLKKPDFSMFDGYDFSVRSMEIFKDNPKYALNAGTIFIHHTKEARSLVEEWVKRCQELSLEKVPSFVDQISLYDVLRKNREAKVLPLPVSYCKIFDLDQFFVNQEDVVIEHRQASRNYR